MSQMNSSDFQCLFLENQLQFYFIIINNELSYRKYLKTEIHSETSVF